MTAYTGKGKRVHGAHMVLTPAGKLAYIRLTGGRQYEAEEKCPSVHLAAGADNCV